MRVATGRRMPRALALGAILLASGAVAQYALDASLSTSSRYNAPRAAPTLNKPIYTVNRTTGEMQYNRANAFNDPTYNIHQRYTHDRYQNFTPAGVSTGASLSRPTAQSRLSANTSRPYTPYGASSAHPSASASHAYRTGYPSGYNSGYSSFSAPTYRASSPSRSTSSSIYRGSYSAGRH